MRRQRIHDLDSQELIKTSSRDDAICISRIPEGRDVGSLRATTDEGEECYGLSYYVREWVRSLNSRECELIKLPFPGRNQCFQRPGMPSLSFSVRSLTDTVVQKRDLSQKCRRRMV